ncbi:uncharacterized protein LOC130663032 [Microplitis mediator]|uniref:uncharacterized protein LOC130663032 n=1 Tax=Microplitis mediator TaxID=375433 RepID=UPI0025543696|nr:uncharacterized protein LOC130663032 [Microplitis mediator]
MNSLGSLIQTSSVSRPEEEANRQLLRNQRFHGRIGDRNSYWLNPAFATAAGYLNFEIPVSMNVTLLSGFHRRNSNVLVYEEKDSVLVVPEKLVSEPVKLLEMPIPSIAVPCQIGVGQASQLLEINLRRIISKPEWQAAVNKIAKDIVPKSTRTVATQIIETRLAPVPEPGCLKCKEKGHSFDKCPNELRGDCYCINCRRLGHTNNTCPYHAWNTEGYRAMKRYCHHCSTQYPFANDSCQSCRIRVGMTKASRGAYLTLPP